MPFLQHQRARVSLIAASALITAAIACNTPTGTSPTATTAPAVDQQQPTTDPANPTDSLPAAPTPTTAGDPAQPTTDPAVATLPPAPPQAPPANADYNGISFYRSNDLASEWTVEITPVGDPGEGPFAQPSHYEFQLTGYAVPLDGRVAQILVYPLDNFNDQYPDQNAEIARLQEFLKTKPTDVPQIEQIPNPSLLTAPQAFHAQMQYVQFQNGEGVRFLTTYKHDVSPVVGSDVAYEFQGFTYDGQYYISVTLPVTHSSIPAEYPLDAPGAYDTFAAQYETYMQQMITTLNGADPSSFTPPLALLDELIHSLNVTPAP